MEQAITQSLLHTLNPATLPQATAQLEQYAQSAEYPLVLLSITQNREAQLPAAIALRNYVRRKYEVEDSANLDPSISQQLKDGVVQFTLSTQDKKIQNLLMDCIRLIASRDFPQDWQSLLPSLKSALTPDNAERNIPVLATLHSIFVEWRHAEAGNELWSIIQYVLTEFSSTYLVIFTKTDELIQNKAQDLKLLYSELELLIELFIDLNIQDIPEFFEDNLMTFMQIFHRYLNSMEALPEENQSEEGPVETIRRLIFEALDLYMTKYEDICPAGMMQMFVENTWNLLNSITQSGKMVEKYDGLISKALLFLTTTIKNPKYKAALFSEDAAKNNNQLLKGIIENIILPNLGLREADEEMYEDDPFEYVRRDLEGADTDTRRRSTSDFVRALIGDDQNSGSIERETTLLFLNYVNFYLEQYNSNPTTNWKSKDTALYLLTSIAAKGVVAQIGVTSTNILVDVVSFFNQQVLPDLQKTPAQVHPILKTDAIKYLYMFRNQLTNEQLLSVFPLLASHLIAEDVVTYTYTAVTIDRILFAKRADKTFINSALSNTAEDIVRALFKLIEPRKGNSKVAENEFVMRAIMRILIVQGKDSVALIGLVLPQLNQLLVEVSANPSNPRFNHYLFESVGSLIRYGGASSHENLIQIENLLFPTFRSVFEKDISDFIPYILQLLAQLLELHSIDNFPEQYKQMVPLALNVESWNVKGNSIALTRFLQSLIQHGAISQEYVNPTLGIFAKLNSSKMIDYLAFDLLDSIFQFMPLQLLAPYVQQIFRTVLSKLMGNRKEVYALRFTTFIYSLAISSRKELGPNFVTSAIDTVEANLYLKVIPLQVLPETQKIKGSIDRKSAGIALIRFLCASRIASQNDPNNLQLWNSILKAIMKLLEFPQQIASTGNDEIEEVDLDSFTFQAAYTKIATSVKRKEDPAPEIRDLKQYFSEQLKKFNASTQIKVEQRLEGNDNSEVKSFVGQYLN